MTKSNIFYSTPAVFVLDKKWEKVQSPYRFDQKIVAAGTDFLNGPLKTKMAASIAVDAYCDNKLFETKIIVFSLF
jgi:hypothetical protein